jgi:dolichyldiphosphatase
MDSMRDFGSLSQLALVWTAVGLAAMFLVRRDLAIISLSCGHLVDYLVNKGLKKAFREPRPSTSTREDFGMPSNHSQFVFFFTTFLILYIIYRVKFVHNIWKWVLFAVISAGALACSYARVEFGHHTVAQVFVGAVVGLATGGLWFSFEHNILRPYIYPIVEEWPISQYFYLRDSSQIDNVLKFEYEMSRKQRGLPVPEYLRKSQPNTAGKKRPTSTEKNKQK